MTWTPSTRPLIPLEAFDAVLPSNWPVSMRLAARMAVRPTLGVMIDRAGINAVYDAVRPGTARHASLEERPTPGAFAEAVLSHLDVSASVSTAGLGRVPKSGPVVVVANHPFGGIDGLILLALLCRVRPDVRIMANYLLGHIPELRPAFTCVDPFGPDRGGGAVSQSGNLIGLRAAAAWLRAGGTDGGGGVLGLFPAGEVAGLRWGPSALAGECRVAIDPAWSRHAAALARRTGAAVVPVGFTGSNSLTFHLAGLVNMRLRTLLLPRELLKKRHARVTVRVGHPLRPDELPADDDAVTAVLRAQVEVLACPDARRREGSVQRPVWPAWPVAASRSSASTLASRLEALGTSACLVPPGRSGLTVYVATADDLGAAWMHELGRQREVAFRGVGEGTDRPVDLDRFDRTYDHLLMWDQAAGRLAGAYRLGRVDRLLNGPSDHSAAGPKRRLYTATLFRFSPQALRRLGDGLELGRSFVSPAYQRHPAALATLWRAIGAFLARHPQYRTLFGPVSVSATYSATARALVYHVLTSRPPRGWRTDDVRPRRPFDAGKVLGPRGRTWADWLAAVPDPDRIARLESAVKDASSKGDCGLPVLLRQYLTLGARAVSGNLDPAFGVCLDLLCVIDAPSIPRRSLDRHMGPAAAEAYRAHHGV